MLILSYPTFAQKVPIGSKRADGTFDLWYVDQNQLVSSAKGLVKLYLDEYNEARQKVGLRPRTISDLKADVSNNLGRNKIAVMVYVEADEPVYLYNHDGILYLATGPVWEKS